MQPRIAEEIEIYKITGVINQLVALSREARKKKKHDIASAYDELRGTIKHDPSSKTHAAWSIVVEALINQHETAPNQEPRTINQEPLTTNKDIGSKQNPIQKDKDSDFEQPPTNAHKVTLTEDWRPNIIQWDALTFKAGLLENDFTDYLTEFIGHYIGQAAQTEMYWQTKLISWMKRSYKPKADSQADTVDLLTDRTWAKDLVEQPEINDFDGPELIEHSNQQEG